MIRYENGLFVLEGADWSYLFKLYEDKLRHVYFGAKIGVCDMSVIEPRYDRGFSPNPPSAKGDRTVSYDTMPSEYGEFGRGDYRTPAVIVKTDTGAVTDFTYVSHELLPSHPAAGGLPTFRGGETLRVDLEDKLAGCRLCLYYTVYAEGLVRRAELTAASPVLVKRFSALTLDLYGTYKATGLYGRHCGERRPDTINLTAGKLEICSSRGASSHQANPFMLLHRGGEEHGFAAAIALVYSGSFSLTAEATQFGDTRVTAGYDPDTFEYPLAAGETLSSPECVLVVSAQGCGAVSRKLHDLCRGYLIPEKYAYAPRPIVINNWESTYFDFDADKLCAMIGMLKNLGIDMFVLDDGWFGRRDNDDSSLGDWFVHKRKLPDGLNKVIDAAHSCGMRFGLWFEPEMVSEDSDLYRAHPDWCIRVPGREPVRGRSQLVLDFSRKEIVDNVFGQMEKILASYDIAYIKWDMNRHITDIPDFTAQYEYMLGVYALARRLTERFPDLMMEGCSGGGGRFDLGMLAFFPQIWTSDNTDAAGRAFIQYGTSFAYPLSAMSNHVSICPNHQTGRVTPFASRGDIAALGAFGYELNPALLTEAERDTIRRQTETYRKYERLVLSGDLYRLKDPLRDNAFCFQLISKDKTLSRITYMRLRTDGNGPIDRVFPRGLDTGAYRIEELNVTYPADAIENYGLPIPQTAGDYATVVFTLKRE